MYEECHVRFRIPSDKVLNRMTQLLVFGERIWTVDDVGRNVGIVLRELCNPKSA